MTRRGLVGGLVAALCAPFVAQPKAVEYGVAIRVADFTSAFTDTPESAREYARVTSALRDVVMHTIRQRGIRVTDAIVVEFKGVPTR